MLKLWRNDSRQPNRAVSDIGWLGRNAGGDMQFNSWLPPAVAAALVTDVIPEGTSRRGLAAPPVSPAMAGANAIAQAQAIRQAEALRLGRRSRPAARAIAQTQQP